MGIKKGDNVKIDYIGKFDDGSVFDASEKHGEPLEFTAGAGQVIPGFDSALMGMEVGQKKSVVISPSDGYGETKEELIKHIPKDRIPSDHEPQKGMMMVVSTPDGGQFPAKIIDVTENDIVIDLNHPLAGKTLHFELTVVGIN